MTGPEGLLAIIDDLAARLAVVEQVVHNGTVEAQEISAVHVITERVEVRDPSDAGPVVEIAAHSSWGAIRVGDGTGRGPHIDIAVVDDGSETAAGQAVPPVASIVVFADDDQEGVAIEATSHYPGRQTLGEIIVRDPRRDNPGLAAWAELNHRRVDDLLVRVFRLEE